VTGQVKHSRPTARRALVFLVALSFVALLVAVEGPGTKTPPAGAAEGLQKIEHVIVIMQENRSFDQYFGTFPGADGLVTSNGKLKPSIRCNPNPWTGGCMQPFVDHRNHSSDPPHSELAADMSINGGRMNGFVRAYTSTSCQTPTNERCGEFPLDVMGYKTKSDIPNYWKYAKNFVLQDRMFEPSRSWSLPAHLYMVSGWSAFCKTHDPFSCQTTGKINPRPRLGQYIYAWTDITYLLHKYGVSWAYYVVHGTEADCEDAGTLSCTPGYQSSQTPGIWNPLPYFDTVRQNRQLGNIKSVKAFYAAAKAGTLPAVSWVVPSNDMSEHPYAGVEEGQSYVTSLINAVMRSPNWNSTAIFVAWDDWGGFYDHVNPPVVDEAGYGFRVPAFLVSPYAKQGYIDHQTLSFDAYLKFVEDIFLGGERIDPATNGRPDPRPSVRENVPILGDLTTEFNFDQPPRKPMILPVHPKTTLTNSVPFHPIRAKAKSGKNRATVTWAVVTRNGGNGGLALKGFVVRVFENGKANRMIRLDTTKKETVVKGLRRGSYYTFKIAGVNEKGVGWYSPPTKPIRAQ
jgi:phospholipase C